MGGVIYGSSWLADILPAIADAADTVWICDEFRCEKKKLKIENSPSMVQEK